MPNGNKHWEKSEVLEGKVGTTPEGEALYGTIKEGPIPTKRTIARAAELREANIGRGKVPRGQGGTP